MLITNLVNSCVEILLLFILWWSEAHSSSVKHRAACFHGFGLTGVGYGSFELLKIKGFPGFFPRGILMHLAVTVLASNSIKSRDYMWDQSPSAIF